MLQLVEKTWQKCKKKNKYKNSQKHQTVKRIISFVYI